MRLTSFADKLVASASRSPRSRTQRQQQHWDSLINAAIPALLHQQPDVARPRHSDARVLMDVLVDLPQQDLGTAALPSAAAAAAAAATAASAQPAHSTPMPSPEKRKGKGTLKFDSKQEEQVSCDV